MPASTEEAKAVVKGYWDDGIKRTLKGDVEALKAHLSPHFVLHTHTHNRHGKSGIAEHASSVMETVKAIPDLQYKVQKIFGEGDLVTAHWRLSGKHGGHHKHRLHDDHLSPTQSDMEVNGITIYRVADGKIAEMWSHDDHIDALIAAGALKVGPAA